jgi:CRISPR-associated protein Csy2
MKDILLIQNIKAHNANALSSPYTIGFPAMTAWLGFMHALERKLYNSEFSSIRFNGLIISCIDINLHTHRGSGDYINSIISTRNPLNKDGKPSSFIEEARCDIEVSIAIECKMGIIDIDKFTNFINKLIPRMKIASGDIISFKNSKHLEVSNNEPSKLSRELMPGFCLVSRQEIMKESMENGLDSIDALLEYIKISEDIYIDDNKKKERRKKKKEKGWLVPIPIGYQAISSLKNISNQRDSKTKHRFAESIVTLGEFKMPYHFDSLDEMMWRYEVDEKQGLYLCKNNCNLKKQENRL